MALDDSVMLRMLASESRAYMEELRALRQPPLDQLSVAEARSSMRAMQNAVVSAYPVTAERHMAAAIPVLIIKPENLPEPLPAVLYFHGGGWVLGDAETHARTIREIAVQAQCAVIFVEYSRAPEAAFPRPLEDCFQALTWAATHGRSLGLDPSRFAVAGDSAGGNLAAAVSLLSLRRGGPQIRLQALLYPVTDCDFNTHSYQDFAEGLTLDLPAMRWFWDRYIPDPSLRLDPLASPLRTPGTELRRLPPALVITAECDVLRDEGEAFARSLSAAGVSVTAVRFLGALHGFMVADLLAHSAEARSAMNLFSFYLRAAL